jgi:ATP-dependent RNA helicase DeaD
MPSVLDRLCVFTKGILELCDPTTPTWAQARLSELLAETGVVPMPAAGQPHPDYHTIIGTAVLAEAPLGSIALVESPGFALRGDRGDLFPLRKAQVRVAGTERRDGAPIVEAREVAHEPVVSDAPRVDAGEGSAAAEAAAPVVTEHAAETADAGSPGIAPAAADHESGHPVDTEGPPDPKAQSAEPVRPAPEADRASSTGQAGRHDQRRDGRNDRGPRDRGDRQRGELPVGPHHGNEPAGDAPALPLVTQVPDELTARPKAEGFRALGLNEQILADLAAIGYQQPTPIQTEAIPQVLAGKDLLGQAQTGTGKTAAFALPILQKLYGIENPDRKPVALVLCPTRELARQVFNEFNRMAGASGARAVCIYGGTPMDDQCRALDRHPHVVVGTPGRIIDHMKRHTLDLSHLAIAVLDEADQMLDIGFWPDVNYIIGHTPPSRQMLLFSATFPDPVKELAAKHMKEPAHIRITPKIVTVEQVDQKYIAVARERKNELLAHFIETQKPEQLVVFCKTKHQTDRVAEVLKRKNMSAAAIHGDLPQSKRERTLLAFRNSELQCLIATNVAARGLDIPTVSHVVNYDIPEMPEEYVHRIGRTARNGAKGIARTFITPEDGQFLLEIEKHIGLLLEEEKIEGFSAEHTNEVKRTIAELPAGAPRILKPLVGGIRLGRRRR